MTTLLTFSLAPHYPWLLLAAIASMAILYSSVGHGGASGYLGAMLLWGLSAAEMRPAALLMNITVTLWILTRLRNFVSARDQVFWPLVIAAFLINCLYFVRTPLGLSADFNFACSNFISASK